MQVKFTKIFNIGILFDVQFIHDSSLDRFHCIKFAL